MGSHYLQKVPLYPKTVTERQNHREVFNLFPLPDSYSNEGLKSVSAVFFQQALHVGCLI